MNEVNDGLKMDRVSSADNDLFWCQADVLETDESKIIQLKLLLRMLVNNFYY